MKTFVKVVRFVGFVITWIVGFCGCVALNEFLMSKISVLANKIKGGDK